MTLPNNYSENNCNIDDLRVIDMTKKFIKITEVPNSSLYFFKKAELINRK